MPPDNDETTGTAKATGTGPRWTTTPDGLMWTDDCQLTSNPTADANPVLALDGSGDAGVVWNRSGMIMFMKIDRYGKTIVAEKTLDNGFPDKGEGYSSSIVGTDSKGSYHICSSPGGNTICYGKYNSTGYPIVPFKSITNGAVNPSCPTITIGKNDAIHLAYNDFRSGHHGTTYARILENGSLGTDGVPASLAGNISGPPAIACDPDGNVHIIYMSVNQGCHHVMLDSWGNHIPSAPPVFLFSDPSGRVWPPSVACDGQGKVHILWNSAGSGTGILKYMKLDNNGTVLSGGSDWTGVNLTGATCRGFPDIQADAMGNAYALWSDVQGGLPAIFYLKIDPGAENDPLLPGRAILLIGDTEWSATDPNVATDSAGLLYVVWKDNRTGNPEIFYKLGMDYGLELDMRPEEMASLLYFHPNETKRANITIRNSGAFNDTFNLSLQVDFHGHAGWNVTLSCRTISLQPKEVRKIIITVKGPPDGLDKDYIETNVTAVSAGNPRRTDLVGIKSYLVITRAFYLKIPTDSWTTGAGVPVTYAISVMDTGDREETIDLGVEGPPWWTVSIEPQKVVLQPFAHAYVFLNVTPPFDAEGDSVGVVKVTGTTEASPQITDSIVTRTTVARAIFLSLAPEEVNATVDPGGTVEYNLTVSEEGNYFVPQNFTLNITTKTGDWNVSFDPPSVVLKSGSVEYVKMRVTAPPRADAGQSLVVRVVCRDPRRTVEANCTVNTTVRELQDIVYYSIVRNIGLSSGLRTVFDVSLQNVGNVPMRLWPGREDLHPGWQTRMETLSGSILDSESQLSVLPGGKLTLRFVVVRPQVNVSGTCSVPGSLVDGWGNRFGFTVDVPVPQFFGVSLASAPDAWSEPGGRVPLWLSICNTGNGQDTVAVICSLLPGWSAVFSTSGKTSLEALQLGPLSEWNESLVVVIPPDCREATVNFLFLATSSGGATDMAQTAIHVRHAELALNLSARSSDRPAAGETVTISLAIDNRGEMDASNVTVRLMDGSNTVAERTLGTIGAGASAFVSFSWNASLGRHTLKMEVDPDDAVVETDESDNGLQWTVDVPSAKTAAPAGSGIPITWAIIGIGVLAAVSVLAVWAAKRRPPGSPRRGMQKRPKTSVIRR